MSLCANSRELAREMAGLSTRAAVRLINRAVRNGELAEVAHLAYRVDAPWILRSDFERWIRQTRVAETPERPAWRPEADGGDVYKRRILERVRG